MRLRSHLLSFAAAVALTAAAVISTARAAERPIRRRSSTPTATSRSPCTRTRSRPRRSCRPRSTRSSPIRPRRRSQAAKDAWKAARVPYQQTEGYRFGNAIVDDWEGKVNAWPLDEGLIDYVDADLYGEESEENPLYTANVDRQPGAPRRRRTWSTRRASRRSCCPAALQEAQGVEANVATGYHAIEFLLWGQDLHGTEAGLGRASGDRLFDDAPARNGNCDRRAAYLKAATDLLVADLEEMVANWKDGGAARAGDLRRRARRRAFHDPDRPRLALLWRARRRAHQARPAAARSGGGARLLLRQHAQQPLLRRDRHGCDLERQIHAHRRLGGRGPVDPRLCDGEGGRMRRSAPTRRSRRRSPRCRC